MVAQPPTKQQCSPSIKGSLNFMKFTKSSVARTNNSNNSKLGSTSSAASIKRVKRKTCPSVVLKTPITTPRASEDGTNSNGSSIEYEFDEMIYTFLKSLEELPPTNPFHIKPLISEIEKPTVDDGEDTEYKDVCKDRLVVYFTRLRGVTKTYNDCRHVLVILKGLRVKIDERVVLMHSGFKEELKELLGNQYSGGGLPMIFLGNRYIGGADEIQRMNEDDKLDKFVRNCEKIEDGGVCEACGYIRFVSCETCEL